WRAAVAVDLAPAAPRPSWQRAQQRGRGNRRAKADGRERRRARIADRADGARGRERPYRVPRPGQSRGEPRRARAAREAEHRREGGAGETDRGRDREGEEQSAQVQPRRSIRTAGGARERPLGELRVVRLRGAVEPAAGHRERVQQREPQSSQRCIDAGPCEDACRDHGRHLDRKSTRLNSSHVKISYAVFCLKKKKKKKKK